MFFMFDNFTLMVNKSFVSTLEVYFLDNSQHPCRFPVIKPAQSIKIVKRAPKYEVLGWRAP